MTGERQDPPATLSDVLVNIGRLDAKIDGIKQDVTEVKDQVTRTNGRVTVIEQERHDEQIRQQALAEYRSPFTKLFWMAVSGALTVMTALIVAFLVFQAGWKR